MKSNLKSLFAAASIFTLLLANACASSTSQQEQSTTSDELRVSPLDMTGSSGSFNSLSVDAVTEDLPTTLMVYRVVPADVQVAWVQERAASLGLEGRVAEHRDRYVIAGQDAVLTVEKDTGSFDYTTAAFEAQTEPIKNILTDDEYRARADAFLTETGLMEPQAEFRDVNHGNVVGVYENGTWVEHPYMVEVRYSHKPLDGVAFDQGVGPKIIVQFGENGEILGAMSVWRDVEPVKDYDLKTLDQALKDVCAGDAQVFGITQDARGTVDEVEISYINEPLGYNQLFVLPSYILRGHAADGTTFTAVCRAIPDDQLSVDESLSGTYSAPLSTGKD